MPPFKKIRVIVNPVSGKNEPIINTLYDVFTEHEQDWDLALTKEAKDAKNFARSAKADGYDLVVAYGGDGTVMEVATGLMESGLPLGVLPGGTANSIAAELTISDNLAEAAKVICDPTSVIRSIDVGQVGNDHYFLMNAGAGFVADNMKDTSREMKDKFGVFAYIASGFKTLREAEKTTYRLTVDGEEIEAEGNTCFIANMSTIINPNLRIPFDIDPTDGLFDVFVFSAGVGTAFEMVNEWIEEKFFGEMTKHWRGKNIHVDAPTPQTFQVDGDVIGETPCEIQLLPKAAQILAPKPLETTKSETETSEEKNL